MAAILDRCVPSRRLEKKRQRALQGSLHARFGDTHITAPTEGAWNQIENDMDKDHVPESVVSGCRSPDLSIEETPSEPRASVEKNIEHRVFRGDSQKNNFTITIPLPWPSRKSHTRTPSTANSATMGSARKDDQEELSPRSFMSSPEATPRSFVSSPDPNAKSFVSSPNTTLQSQASSPVVIYKPASEEYKQQLADMASGINRVDSPAHLPPDRTQNVSPVNVMYKPASENFAKEMAEVGMGLSPALLQRETFARPRAQSKPAPTGLLLDPLPTPGDYPPDPLLAHKELPLDQKLTTVLPSPESRTTPLGLPPDPRPAPVSRSPDPNQAPTGLLIKPRIGTTRCASRGPAADRIGTTRSASPGPTSDRAGHTRSSSRGPRSDRVGTTRSASRGPPPDRICTRRASSRGPTSDRLPSTRSASRGPLSERPVNTSHCRSSSRGPTSTRIPYRESVSSSSSSSSADSGITSSSSPTCSNNNSSFTTTTITTALDPPATATVCEPRRNDSVGSATGYYAAIAQDYRRIACDVEDLEAEKRRRGLQSPQEMVPDADELW